MKTLVIGVGLAFALAGAVQARPTGQPPRASFGSQTGGPPSGSIPFSQDRRNVAAHPVHTPPPSRSGDPPSTSARCNDGGYSVGETHEETCAHHGGVSAWLANAPERTP